MQYRFTNCLLDLPGHRLLRDGVETHVEPQVFALLALLCARNGAVVSRDEIIAEIWQGRFVSESAISARVSAARAAVGDDGRAQAVIRTVPRVGVQMVVPVAALDDHSPGTNQIPSGDGAAAAPRDMAGHMQRDMLGDPPKTAPDAAKDIHPGPVRLTTGAEGAGIAWREMGQGAPLLRAGHWMTHLELDHDNPIWAAWLAGLARGRRLVRYDPRGTGLSQRDCGPVTLDLLVEDLRAVADAAGLSRFPIFGSSQSVAVACLFAARHPERVSKLVLYGGFPQGPNVRDPGSGAAMTQAMAQLIMAGWGKPATGAMRSFSSLFVPEATPEQVQGFVETQVASSSAERAAEYRAVFADVDVTGVLPRIEAPTLVLHAADDSLQPFSQSLLLARLMPQAQLQRLESVNHILVPQEPAFAHLMTAVDRFLASWTSAARVTSRRRHPPAARTGP